MLGAIAGDIIGSVHEGTGTKTKEFSLFGEYARFTDDTVLTIAVAECLLTGADYVEAFHRYFANYPRAGYGGTFHRWAERRETRPYNSWGNGSAMRVSPVGWAFGTVDDVLRSAFHSAEVTHDHPEGLRGAQATALAVFLARTGSSKDEIRQAIVEGFGYELCRTLEEIRPDYEFEVSCQKSVPESIIAFLESTDYEDAVRNAISLGGDADTMACIAGGIAEAYYGGVPAAIEREVERRLDPDLSVVLKRFRDRYEAGRR